LFNELSNVIRVTKPKHILKTIISPSHTLKAIKYHYRRVSERDFISFIAKQIGVSDNEIDSIYNDLKLNNTLWDENKKRLILYPNCYGSQMTRELPSLYLMVRLMKPLIIETGVSSGASSAYILQALIDNKKGELISIDLPPDSLPEGKESGWVVPRKLRDLWNLHIGDSKIILKQLLDKVGIIDVFLHDSLHTYEHMVWEFNTAWQFLRKGGLFLSHDVGANEAFFDFMKQKNIHWKNYRVFHVLGAFAKH